MCFLLELGYTIVTKMLQESSGHGVQNRIPGALSGRSARVSAVYTVPTN